MNNMFGKGGAPTEAGKHAVLGTKIATPDQAGGDIETATFGLGWYVFKYIYMCACDCLGNGH